MPPAWLAGRVVELFDLFGTLLVKVKGYLQVWYLSAVDVTAVNEILEMIKYNITLLYSL